MSQQHFWLQESSLKSLCLAIWVMTRKLNLRIFQVYHLFVGVSHWTFIADNQTDQNKYADKNSIHLCLIFQFHYQTPIVESLLSMFTATSLLIYIYPLVISTGYNPFVYFSWYHLQWTLLHLIHYSPLFPSLTPWKPLRNSSLELTSSLFTTLLTSPLFLLKALFWITGLEFLCAMICKEVMWMINGFREGIMRVLMQFGIGIWLIFLCTFLIIWSPCLLLAGLTQLIDMGLRYFYVSLSAEKFLHSDVQIDLYAQPIGK